MLEIIHHNLEESLKILFEDFPMATTLADFSETSAFINAQNIPDSKMFQDHLATKPEFVKACLAKIKICAVNNQTLELYEMADEKEFHEKHADAMNETTLDAFKETLLAIYNNETFIMKESELQPKEDLIKYFIFNWKVVSGYESNYARVLVSFLDISNKKRGEHDLKESERRLKALTSMSPVGIFYTDKNIYNITYINSHLEKLLDQTPEEAKGLGWLKAIHIDDRKRMMALAKKIKRGALQHSKLEYRIVQKSGKIIWCYAESVPEYDKAGHILGTIGTVTDITKIKEATEIRNAYEAKARINAANEIISSIAHEVNQPLTSINQYIGGCIELLRKEKCCPKIIDTLNRALKQSDRAGSIVNNLKIYFRSGESEPSEININQLLTETIELLEHELITANVKLNLNFDPMLPLFRGNATQLQQVFVNLFNNAIESIKEGDVPCLHLQTTFQNNEIRINVSDNGCGISEMDSKRVFEPFYTTKVNGMGIGLSLTKSFLEVHRGHINLFSDPDHGTTFSITLPVKQEVLEYV